MASVEAAAEDGITVAAITRLVFDEEEYKTRLKQILVHSSLNTNFVPLSSNLDSLTVSVQNPTSSTIFKML